jgi:S1-C subfamily serine protease
VDAKKEIKMVETIEVVPSTENKIDALNIPVIFVEENEEEVNGLTINGLDSDHYSPSVRVVYVTKDSNTNSGFGFHLSRSKWDPYPYISGVDKSSPASNAGLKEGDCVLEVYDDDD